MKYKGGDVNLDLRENTRLNANAPIYEHRFDKERNMRVERNNKIQPNNVSKLTTSVLYGLNRSSSQAKCTKSNSFLTRSQDKGTKSTLFLTRT